MKEFSLGMMVRLKPTLLSSWDKCVNLSPETILRIAAVNGNMHPAIYVLVRPDGEKMAIHSAYYKGHSNPQSRVCVLKEWMERATCREREEEP